MTELTQQTTDLIDRLSAGLTPTPNQALSRRVGIGVVSGTAASLIVVLALWGTRPDFPAALLSSAFWLKAGFTFVLGLAGFIALHKLARPDGTAPQAAWLVFAVVIVMALLAGAQLMSAPLASWRALLLGNTFITCPWLILSLAIPIFIGSLWAMRALAPTRLRLAGAAAGLTAGAFSAFVYSISCDEHAMPFVFIWYGGAIAVMALLGFLLGPRVLRW
jgi:hypothetical protein